MPTLYVVIEQSSDGRPYFRAATPDVKSARNIANYHARMGNKNVQVIIYKAACVPTRF